MEVPPPSPPQPAGHSHPQPSRRDRGGPLLTHHLQLRGTHHPSSHTRALSPTSLLGLPEQGSTRWGLQPLGRVLPQFRRPGVWVSRGLHTHHSHPCFISFFSQAFLRWMDVSDGFAKAFLTISLGSHSGICWLMMSTLKHQVTTEAHLPPHLPTLEGGKTSQRRTMLPPSPGMAHVTERERVPPPHLW